MSSISQKKKFSIQDIFSMRTWLIVLAFSFSQIAFSQSKDLEKADELFNSFKLL